MLAPSLASRPLWPASMRRSSSCSASTERFETNMCLGGSVEPAEGGNVVVRAEQDARLAGARLGGQQRRPPGEAHPAAVDPARHDRDAPGLDLLLKDRVRQAVDLDEDEAGPSRANRVAASCQEAADEHRVVRVVRVEAEQPAERRVDDGENDRGEERIDCGVEMDARHERDECEE